MENVVRLNVAKKEDDARHEGTVKWWSDVQRMGFIVSGENEYYINDKRPEIYRALREGVNVSFMPYTSLRGPEARELEIL